MKSISIIIPCYNAEKFIKKNFNILIKKLNNIKINYEIILINDGSTDNTKKIINNFNYKNLKLIHLFKNKGKSFAVRLGLKKAYYNYIILIDCDLPYFEKFNLIIKRLKQGYDFVSIDRRHKKSVMKGKNLNMYQFCRHLVGNIIGKIIHMCLPLKLNTYDTQAGLKGLKTFKNFNKINFISKKFFLDLELIYIFLKKKKSFYYIPTKYNINKKSSIKFFSLNSLNIFFELISVIIFFNFYKN